MSCKNSCLSLLRSFLIPAIALLLIPLSTTAQWSIDSSSNITFSGSSASGSFSEISGNITFDPEDLSTANFDVSVAISSISTGNKTKDKHALNSSWFDEENHPRARFISKVIVKTDDGFRVIGDMMIHGFTMEMRIDFTFSGNTEEGRFNGAMVINRNEFGINGSFMAFMVGDEFEVNLDVLVKQ